MIKASLKKLSVATFGLLILLLALSPGNSVFAQAPGLGHAFSGTLKVDGEDAAIGTVITAHVDGTKYGSCTVNTPGFYGLIVHNDITEGATIYFYVSGQEADQTFPFHDGWTTTLDLTAPAPSVQYDLSISSTEGGSITGPGVGNFTYGEGTIVDLLATPDAGYRFVEWTGDVNTIDDVYATATTITMQDDYSITANFEEITEYDLSISSTKGGSVMGPGVGNFTYGEGTIVGLLATPDAGYRFVEWTGDVGTIANINDAITTITMQDDYSITANFGETSSPFPFPFPFQLPCFIATAAYGTSTAEQLDVLREFRDVVLLESAAGSRFVALYYRLSPPVADFIARSDLVRTLVRELLVDPVVWIVEATGDIWRN